MRLNLFARTFLLSAAALLVAVGVGAALLLTHPPPHNAPVRLSEIARELSGSPLFGLRHGVREGGPPEGWGDRPGAGMGPGQGPPPMPRDGAEMRGPPPNFRDVLRREWQIHDETAPPEAPKDADLAASDILRHVLAVRLGVNAERTRMFVREPPAGPGHGPGFADDPELRDGFIAAWQLDSGNWRVMRSEVEAFPNAFQRQVFWLLAIGLVLLLPISWWFARSLASPIRHFAEGARRLGSDPHAPQLARQGTPEMLDAIDAFNGMQSRITRLLQERSQMVGAIAHDLRTPLMRLAFRLDGLESPLKEKVEADIQEMKLMISAALDFMRDQATGGARERLDLRLLVESVVDDQSDVGHDVSLASGEPVTLQGDPLALRRMVMNLVENALKYGERARLRLRDHAGSIALEVDDDGPGIPENLQQRVFEPFFRAESSRNRETGGIGLGLTTVRAIVLDHGGQIELRNRKEGGLRVVVTLPLNS